MLRVRIGGIRRDIEDEEDVLERCRQTTGGKFDWTLVALDRPTHPSAGPGRPEAERYVPSGEPHPVALDCRSSTRRPHRSSRGSRRATDRVSALTWLTVAPTDTDASPSLARSPQVLQLEKRDTELEHAEDEHREDAHDQSALDRSGPGLPDAASFGTSCSSLGLSFRRLPQFVGRFGRAN